MEKIGTKAIRESLAGIPDDFRVLATVYGKTTFGLMGHCNILGEGWALNLHGGPNNKTIKVHDLRQFMGVDGREIQDVPVAIRLWEENGRKIAKKFKITQLQANHDLGNFHLMLQEI